jgi:hypothetical protein
MKKHQRMEKRFWQNDKKNLEKTFKIGK